MSGFVSRRRARGVALIAAGVAAVAIVVWLVRTPVVAAHAVKVAGGDTAIVISTDDTRGWISRISATGTVLWWRELPGMPELGDPIRIGADVIAVRYRTEDTSSMVAYSHSGDRRWQRAIAGYRPDPHKPRDTTGDGAVVGDRFLEEVSVSDGTDLRLYSVDAATGDVAWNLPWQPWVMMSTIGTHLISFDIRMIRDTDAREGDGARRRVNGVGCVIDRDYLALLEDDSLVRFAGGDLDSPRELRRSFGPVPARSRLAACGSYRDRLVMLVDVESDGVDTTRVMITDREGRDSSVLTLPPDFQFSRARYSDVALRHGTRVPFGGSLPRFVPFVQADADAGMVMVDLETTAIAWRGRARRAHSDTIFRDGDRWYLSTASYLATFDGKTGRLDAAIALLNDEVVGPDQIADGRIWLLQKRGEANIDSPPITVLDSTTLARISGRGVIDILPVVRATLGASL